MEFLALFAYRADDTGRPEPSRLCLLLPVEADSFAGLPPAYIETAEFDCLHDDGILYAEQLRAAGIAVTLNETRGTMHGFDIVQHAKTTKAALAARIAFMRARFDETANGKD